MRPNEKQGKNRAKKNKKLNKIKKMIEEILITNDFLIQTYLNSIK